MLPTGTVTFLLTDVEGSTALWEEAPEAMRAALARHDILFEQAVQAHNGAHIRPRGEGDRRFAVFPSEAVVALVRDDLPGTVSLLDLGLHRLRDLTRPERVAQLSADDVPASFPPLASLNVRPHNLPVQTTSLVGRERELVQIRGLLHQHAIRLLTLTGPGGTGKTRLSLQVAADLIDRFVDGVFFVDLAPIGDPALIGTTIAPVLGVVESGERLLDDVKRFLEHRSLVLVLDNFEQILDGASVVVELLAASASLKVLVTSRAALNVRGEHQIEIPPLAVPDLAQAASLHPPVEVLQQCPAVALFVERAQAARADFVLTSENGHAVATICARLDGLPLALELAAARIRLLSPEAMARRLEQRLPLLTGGARDLPARERALRDTIAWSYDLLSEPERRLFRWLSVFVGGFTLEAAAAICEGGSAEENATSPSFDVLEGVDSLVGHSLVRQREGPDGEPRFTMLETIREFGLERLEVSGEASAVRARHLAFHVEITERMAEEIEHRPSGLSPWLRWLDAELDNLRAALHWSDHPSHDVEAGLRLAGGLVDFWSSRGHHREARAWLARLLARSSAPTIARADALETWGYLALRQGDYAAGDAALGEALAIRRERDDRRRMIRTLRYVALICHHQREYDRARVLLDESLTLARELNQTRGLATTLRFLADLEYDCADYARAAVAYGQSLTLAREMGSVHGIADALRGLGNLARARGEYSQSRDLLRESLSLFASMSDRRCTPICLEGLACTEVGADWAERAVRMLAAAQAFQETTGAPAPPAEMADHRRTEADARAQLGEERFAAAWSAGASMSLDEAVAYALAADAAVMAPAGQASSHAEPPAGVPLSAREREVVTLIAQGLSNREISEALVLSVRTVERHIENVYNRLGISGKAGRAIVTAYALRHGVATPA